MFSEAFLTAYEGDLEGAYRSYRRAFESPLADPNVPVECEDFIQIVLDPEPDKPRLYFCLGLLNIAAREIWKRQGRTSLGSSQPPTSGASRSRLMSLRNGSERSRQS